MQHLSAVGQNAVSDISNRYNISPEAAEHMLIAVNNGSGQMAQFNCPELGGSGQWMRGGMIMVGDMFNHGLKQTVDNLCNELSNLLANEQVFPVIPAGTPGSAQWWPADLGTPFSSGSQNNTRYALFAGRLAVELNGLVTLYDTLDHQIGGVSQQQGGNTSLNFSSQYGTLSVSSLPVVSAANGSPKVDTNFADTQGAGRDATDSKTLNAVPVEPHTAPAYPEPQAMQTAMNSPVPSDNASGNDIIGLIEQLGQLHNAGVLSDAEFNTKKRELLGRL